MGDASIGINSTYPSITSDEKFLYVLTNQGPSVVHKFSLVDFSHVDSINLTGLNYGHSIRYDGRNLFASGADSPAWIARINPSNLSYISQHFAKEENIATDDMAVDNKDYIFICLETKDGVILRIKKDSLSEIDRIYTGVPAECYGVFSADGYIWALFNTSPGKIAKIDPYKLTLKRYIFSLDESSPNEFTSDGNNYFVSFWMYPVKIMKLSMGI